MSSYLLSDGLNKIDKLNAEPTGDVGIRPNTGETGVYFYEKNFRVYTRDSSTSAWSEDTSSGDNSGSYVSKLVSWTGVDRIYVRTLDGVSDISGDTRVYPRSENISTPAPAGVAYTTIETLSDVPDYAAADAGKYLAINSSGDEIEFVDAPSGGGGSVTYNTTDYFIVEHSEHLTSGKGTLLMNSSNLYSGSAPVLSSNEPGSDAGSTLSVGAISIPSGSRIVGAEWRVLEAFTGSSSTSEWSAYGAIDFGDGKKFTPGGKYDVDSIITTTVTDIYSSNLYYIAAQTTPAQDFSSVGASSNAVGTTFYASGSTTVNSGVEIHQLDYYTGIKEGDTVEFLSDGTLYWSYGSATGSFQDIGAPSGIASGETFVADFSGITGTQPDSYEGVKIFDTSNYVHGGAGAKIATALGGVFHSASSGNFGPYALDMTGVSVQGYINFPSYVPNVSGDIVPKLCWGPSYAGGTQQVPSTGMLAIRFVYI